MRHRAGNPRQRSGNDYSRPPRSRRALLSKRAPWMTAAMQPLTEEQLSRVIDPAKNRTLRWSILHGLHDEANHQGEMWLLRKMYERRAK